MVESESSRSPLPSLSGFGFQDNFFGNGICPLLLLDIKDISFCEVLIEEHTVIQVLITCHGTQYKVTGLIFDVDTRIEQSTAVTAAVVIWNFTDVVCPVLCNFFTLFFSFGYAVLSNPGIVVRIPALVAIFIVHGHVYFQIRCRQVNPTKTSASGVAFVDFFIVPCRVFKEAARVFVETSGRKSKAVGYTVIMGEWNVIIIVSCCSHANIGTLISERRFCVHLDKSSHRVTSVEGTLWPAKNINTFDISIVEVESGFVDIRDIVYIKSYGRSIDAWADSADINRSSQFGTVVRDKQIGNNTCQVLYGIYLIGAHILLW